MRLIIVGCGGMGTYQAKKFQQLGATIVGAIDHNRAKLDAFCSTFSVPWLSSSLDDLALMQGKADAVSCTLPDTFHLVCCSKILSLGFALFAEKPLGTTLSDARGIIQASEPTALPAMVNYSKRNMQALYALQTVLSEGVLGTLSSVRIEYNQGWVLTNAWGDWRTDSRWKWRLLSSDCIGDLASHLVDILYFLFGTVLFSHSLEVVTLESLVLDGTIQLDEAYRKTFLSGGSAAVAYEGSLLVGEGIPCTLSCTQISPTAVDSVIITVAGSTGTVSLDSSVSRKGCTVSLGIGTEYYVEGPSVIPSTYESFIRWVDEGLPARPNLSDGLRVQKILEEMKQWRSR